MAQTTNAKTFIRAAVDLSADNSAWTEIDGFGASIAVDGGERTVAEAHTFEGDTPVIGAGKRGSLSLTVRFLYTEQSSDPFEIARAIYETEGGACYVRYSPLGDSTSGGAAPFRFSTGAAVMTNFLYPQGDAKGEELIPGEFTVKCASLAKAAVA